MTIKTVKIPREVHHSETPDFKATIREIRDLIEDYMEDGLRPGAGVYSFDAYVVPYPDQAQKERWNVRELVAQLYELVEQGHGEDGWQFNCDDGWHDVIGLVACVRSGNRWVLLLGFGESYQDEEDDDETQR